MKSRLQENTGRDGAGTDEALWLEEHDGCAEAEEITVNIGLGEASQNAKLLDTAAVELGQITGRKR